MYNFITEKEDPEEKFQIIEKLGQGNYGSVFKVLDKKTGQILAAKIATLCGNIESFKKELDDVKKQFDIYKAKMESLLISQLELIKDINKDDN